MSPFEFPVTAPLRNTAGCGGGSHVYELRSTSAGHVMTCVYCGTQPPTMIVYTPYTIPTR